ncbi:MAG: nucleotide exchange factor GrpE [Halobacteria archaeon]|nr:nucleotide exchange factor GrpE [Halobacteria archaeon]
MESDESGKPEQETDDESQDEVEDTEKEDEKESIEKRVDELEQELKQKDEELQKKEEEIEDLESRLKRVQADFQNYKKRSEKEKEKFAKYATADLISELLEVKDNLERALESEGDIRDGVEMTLRTLDEILEDEGVERIDTEGEFDPEKHEAMMQVESDEHDEGEVVDVYEPGYSMNGRVIRTAKVTVAKGSGTGEDENKEDDEEETE